MRHQFGIITLTLLCVCQANLVNAATYDWTNPLGGNYPTAANWVPSGPPSVNDTARFSLAATYTVTFPNSLTINTVTQTQGDVTFNLDGETFNTSNTSNNGMGAAGSTSTLRIIDGNFRPGNFAVGNVAGSVANLFLDTDSTARTNTGTFYVGSLGTGNLWIQNAATLQNNSGAALGVNTGAKGTATVAGQDSAWTVTGSPLIVGGSGAGFLNVLGGGTVTTASLEVGQNLESLGTVSLNGNLATFTTNGTANIGGSSASSPAASATLNIGTGSTMNLNGTTNFRTNAKVNLTGGTLNLNTVNITSGAKFNWSAGILNFATAPTITGSVLESFLDNTHILGTNRTLSATAGIFTLTTPLDLAGGKISAPSIVINANMDLGAFSTITATNLMTIQPGATLQMRNFSTMAAGTSIVNNGGTILLNGPLANITGVTTNTQGYVQGTGRFKGGLNNALAGVIRAEANDHLIIDTLSTNLGAIELAGGIVEYSQALINSVGGVISGRGVFRGSSAAPGGNGLTNNGVASFSAGITDIFGDVNNTASGIIVAAGASTVTFYDDVVNNGEIRTVTGSRTVFFGDVTGAGPFTGGGTVELEGDLRPGNSPANVSFGGSFILNPTGALNIELGGIAKGSQYDALTIAGTASLSGALSATLINGFVPSPGQSFQILSAAGGISGGFDAIDLPALAGGLYFDLGYTANTITLSVAGMLGDYNRSGDIDAADYVVWRKTMSQSGAALAADGNNNGVIDGADFAVWRQTLDERLESAAAAARYPRQSPNQLRWR